MFCKSKDNFILDANNILASEGYCLKETGQNIGIYSLGPDTQDLLSPMTIFPVSISKYIGDEQSVVEKISTYHCDEMQCPIEHCGKFQNIEDKILRTWGSKVVPYLDHNNLEVMEKVFLLLCQSVETEEVFSKLGWHDDYTSYILGNIIVKPDTFTIVKNSLVKKSLKLGKVPLSEVDEYLKNVVFKLTDDGEFAMHLVVFTVLSLSRQRLVENYNVCPGFVLAIIGSTNSRKTSSVNAICNPLGLPTASFEDTERSIIQSLKEPFYAPIIIDDFNIRSREKTRKFESVVRNCGDLTTNSRKIVGGRVLNDVTANMCVITGEDIPILQASSMPRMLIYELEYGDVDLDVLSNIQQNSNMILTLFIIIIKRIFDNEAIEGIYMSMIRERKRLQSEFEEQKIYGRYIDMISWMIAAWNVLAELFPDIEMYDYPSIIKERLLNQSRKFADDPVNSFIFCLSEMKDNNLISVYDEEYPSYKPKNPDLLVKGSELIVVSENFYNKLLKFYKEEFGRDFPCRGERHLRELLYKAGKLKKNSVNLNTKQYGYCGGRISGFCLYKNLL